MSEPGQPHHPADGDRPVGAVWAALARLRDVLDDGPGLPVGRQDSAADGSARDSTADDEVREAAATAEIAIRRLVHAARQDMTVIKGRAQLLRRRVMAARTADLVLLRGLDEIDHAVDRLETLIAAHLDPSDGSRSRPDDS